MVFFSMNRKEISVCPIGAKKTSVDRVRGGRHRLDLAVHSSEQDHGHWRQFR